MPTADPVDTALALIGPRWSLLIVRHLLDGPRRYVEIEQALERANPKTITVRLRELEASGLLTRTVFPEVPPRVEYALTERGRALRPVVEALRTWGSARGVRPYAVLAHRRAPPGTARPARPVRAGRRRP